MYVYIIYRIREFFYLKKSYIVIGFKDGILGKINIIICKVGLIFLDCYNLWLV